MVYLHSSGKVTKTQYNKFGYAGMLCPEFQEYGEGKIPGAYWPVNLLESMSPKLSFLKK